MRACWIFFFILIRFLVNAQDANFSLPGSVTGYLNPALIDHSKFGSLKSTYRLQWPKLDGGYNQLYNEYSHYFKRMRGYFTVFNLYENNYVISLNNLFLNYTQTILLGKKIVIKPTFGVGYFNRKIDWTVLSFGDMIDPRSGFIYNTNDIPRGGKVTNVDFRAGLAVNLYDLTLGFSVLHLTQPDQSLIKGKSPLPMHFCFQAGYNGVLLINREKELKIQPFFCYDVQNASSLILFGSYVELPSHWRAGIGFRLKDAINLMAGYNHEYFSINLGYDYTISDLKGYTGGAYEVSIGLRILGDKHPAINSVMDSPFK